ncbi:putative odorant receptor 92a [Photinus pyralis]|uniref:putative odorant receptor 92a n=1 Tax=Photinus pyralis TaxID=7054 RepID=UPI001266ED24|nr:putative odorant receptor 92a [Photinus pyralis]
MYSIAIATAAPFITIMRLQRRRLVNLIALLEDDRTVDMRFHTESIPQLRLIANTLARLAFPVVMFIDSISFIAWYLSESEKSLPYGTMPSWALEHRIDYVMLVAMKWCVLLHLRIHFKYLNITIKEATTIQKGEVFDDNESELYSSNTAARFPLNEHVRGVIARYSRLTLIATEAERAFNKGALSNFINISIFVCFVLFRMSNIPIFTMEFLKLFWYLLTMLSMIFLDSYLCSLVVEESESLVYSCYETDFVDRDRKFQKALVLLMTRAQKPVIFTIGNFAPLSMETVIIVLKASVSYFMLLRNVRGETS